MNAVYMYQGTVFFKIVFRVSEFDCQGPTVCRSGESQRLTARDLPYTGVESLSLTTRDLPYTGVESLRV